MDLTNHEVAKTMLLNNMDFYNDIRDGEFDIRLFERSLRKRKWCPRQVIGFLAFGRVFKGVDSGEVRCPACPAEQDI